MIRRILSFILLIVFGGQLSAQNTVGLLSLDATKVYEGYTLLYPHNQPHVFLINNCGEIVHTWMDEDNFRPGNTAYLREDGTLVKAKRPAAVGGDAIWAGGGGAIIEIRSWDNELLWSYTLNDESDRLHHDIALTDEGTIIAIAWENITKQDAIEMGRDTSLLSQDMLWPDYLLEIDPTKDSIVWEWHATDHLIQDFDSTKQNYGVVADHPELINLNYATQGGKADWLHSNSIDYNAELDHIMISVPHFHEIWVIDHSTTTQQAASHLGGKSNHGGDLIYRVGNLAAYDRGTEDDQILFFQHDAHWVDDFVPETFPFKDQIAVYNNRVGADYSTAEVFAAPWNMYIIDYERFDNTWPPYEFTNTITHPDSSKLYSTGLSSIQLLANGNRLLTAGRTGYTVELSPDNDIVWEYITPLKKGVVLPQGDTSLVTNDNLTFRSYKYPTDYVAFDNRDLSIKGYLESSPDTTYCSRLVPTITLPSMSATIYPNPASDMVQVTWDTGGMIDIAIYDSVGRLMQQTKGNGGMKFLDIRDLKPGLYIVTLDGYEASQIVVR